MEQAPDAIETEPAQIAAPEPEADYIIVSKFAEITPEQLTEEDYLIIPVGATGCGRTNFIDCLFGRKTPVATTAKRNMDAQGKKIVAYRIFLNASEQSANLTQFVVLDVPGYDRRDKLDVNEAITQWLSQRKKKTAHIAGVLYLHRMISPIRPRMESDLKKLLKSLASASERNANDVQVFAQPFILVETNWDWLTQNPHKCDKAKKAGDELQQFFGELIGEGNPAFRFYHTKESAWEIVNYALRRYDDAVRSGDPLRAGAVDVMRRFRRPLSLQELLQLPFKVSKDDTRMDDVVIVAMGPTGSGKSSFISAAVEGQTQIEIGHGLKSCTVQVNGIRLTTDDPTCPTITFVDTPGFDDAEISDAETLDKIAQWLRKRFGSMPLSGILYFHRISDNRMANTAVRNLEVFRQLCGKRIMNRVVFVTTMWEEEDMTIELGRHRLDELRSEYWSKCVEQGARISEFRRREKENVFEIIQPFVTKYSTPPSSMKKHFLEGAVRLQRELEEKGLKLGQTSAGQEVFDKLGEDIEAREREVRRLEDLCYAHGYQDEDTEEMLARQQDFLKILKAGKAKLEMTRSERFMAGIGLNMRRNNKQ